MKKLLLAGVTILALVSLRGIAASPGGGSKSAASAQGGGITGRVVETMNAASYTYVLVDTGSKKVWAAAPQFAVKAGDAVAVAEAMPMANYHSKTLNRTFDVVYFSGQVTVNGARPAAAVAELPKDHPATTRAAGPVAPDLSGIKRATNGQTVAEIHAGKATLAGKPIAVRGRVVKFNAMIMGKNWLHLRDGSGADGTNDLTVTTAAQPKVGDLVLVTGVLSANRDFGSGYKYGLIVEDATVAVE
jgi:hypothetical protein